MRFLLTSRASDRARSAARAESASDVPNARAADATAPDNLRRRVLSQLLETLEQGDTSGLVDDARIVEHVDEVMDAAFGRQNAAVTDAQRQRARQEVIDEIRGYGPLTPLMADPGVSDILVNGPDEVWVDRAGRLEKTEVRFDDERHLRRLLDRLVAGQGKHLDAASPHVDAILIDGSRLHAVVPPLSRRGPIVSIRRFRAQALDAGELLARGFLTQAMLELLQLAVDGRLNIVIAGGAAAGKTTFLNFLASYIPSDERVVTIEETAELRLGHPHVVSLQAKAHNVEGRGGIGLRELLRTALRMRADRIVVGEARGEEVLDMLQAMNVGHDGSLTTVHASTAGDVVRRLETLAMISGAAVPRETVRDLVASAIDLIVFLARFRNGQRRITAIHELERDSGEVRTKELYRFDARKTDPDGGVDGDHMEVGVPRFVGDLAAKGYPVPGHLLTTQAVVGSGER